MRADRSPARPPIPQSRRGYICPKCDLVLADGVAYERCPACDLAVDWVHLDRPAWACARCDELLNERRAGVPYCHACERRLALVHDPSRQAAPCEASAWRFFSRPWVLSATCVASMVPVVSMAAHPDLRTQALAAFGPLILAPIGIGVAFLTTLAGSLRELRDLLADGNTRIMHGLEHATLKVLERRGVEIVGGHARKSSFIASVKTRLPQKRAEALVRSAAREAIAALRSGQSALAYDPRCGTSLIAGATFLALVSVGAGAVGLFATLPPKALLALLIVLVVAPLVLIRPLGLLAQRLFTVSTEFERAGVRRVELLERNEGVARFAVHVEASRRRRRARGE